MPPRTLRAFPQLDPKQMPVDPHTRSKTGTAARGQFTGNRLNDKLALALIDARVLPFKELLESFEVFEHIRRRVRAPQVVDLCCGHGLVGMLYGIHHRDVERVRLVDRRRPESVDRILAALDPVAPWLRPRSRLKPAPSPTTIDPPAAILGIHACGTATDAVIDQALPGIRSRPAMLPSCARGHHARCCIGGNGHRHPPHLPTARWARHPLVEPATGDHPPNRVIVGPPGPDQSRIRTPSTTLRQRRQPCNDSGGHNWSGGRAGGHVAERPTRPIPQVPKHHAEHRHRRWR